MTTHRVALSLSAPFASDLTYVALRFGRTKSQLVEDLLAAPLGDLRTLLYGVPTSLATLTPAERAALYGELGSALDSAAKGAADVSRELREVSA